MMKDLRSSLLLLSLLDLRHAHAAALGDFYYLQKQQSSIRPTSTFSSASTPSSTPQQPSLSISYFASVLQDVIPFASLGSSHSTVTIAERLAYDTVDEPSNTDARRNLPETMIRRGDLLQRRQEGDAVQPAEPAWITSPLWALYSFSADLYPPPTASAAPLPEATEDPNQLVTAMATGQIASSVASVMTSMPSTFDTSTIPSTSASQTSISSQTTSTTPSSSASTSTSTTPSRSQPVSTSTSSSSSPTSTTSAALPQHQSTSHATAIVVGVLVPVISLIILTAVILAYKRHKQSRKLAGVSRSRSSRFNSPDSRSPSTGLSAGLAAGVKKLRSNSRGLLSNTSSPEVPEEKTPAAYDPPPAARHTTTILSGPGRLPSPSRHAELQQQRLRANSEAALLTDGFGNDVRDLDFHCEGNSTRGSGDTARFAAGLPSGSPTGAGAYGVVGSGSRPQRTNTQRSQGSSWLSTSSFDSTRDSSRPSMPSVPDVPPLPSQPPLINVTSPPAALRNVNENTSSHWWPSGSSGLGFDSYHPGVAARDFALGNHPYASDRRTSAARSSLSLSSGPWSDSEDEDMAEVPLTIGSDVRPGSARWAR